MCIQPDLGHLVHHRQTFTSNRFIKRPYLLAFNLVPRIYKTGKQRRAEAIREVNRLEAEEKRRSQLAWEEFLRNPVPGTGA